MAASRVPSPPACRRADIFGRAAPLLIICRPDGAKHNDSCLYYRGCACGSTTCLLSCAPDGACSGGNLGMEGKRGNGGKSGNFGNLGKVADFCGRQGVPYPRRLNDTNLNNSFIGPTWWRK